MPRAAPGAAIRVQVLGRVRRDNLMRRCRQRLLFRSVFPFPADGALSIVVVHESLRTKHANAKLASAVMLAWTRHGGGTTGGAPVLHRLGCARLTIWLASGRGACV